MGGIYKNRFDRYQNGAVPQNVENRTLEQQLACLNTLGFVAKKERAKLALRIASKIAEEQKKVNEKKKK